MKKNPILSSFLVIFCLFTLITPAFAEGTPDASEDLNPIEASITDGFCDDPIQLDPAQVAATRQPDCPLSANDVFSDTNYLFIRRYGEKIINDTPSNSSRIADNADNQTVSWNDIWKIDQIDLYDAQNYTVKIQFNYDYTSYGDKELWLHLTLPQTTTADSDTYLTAFLTLIDPHTSTALAQSYQYITLHTLDTGQTLKFHPSFQYVELPKTITTSFATLESLTPASNLLFQIPTTDDKGIILISFQSENTKPALLTDYSAHVWHNPTPILPLITNHASTTPTSTDIPINTPSPAPSKNSTSILHKFFSHLKIRLLSLTSLIFNLRSIIICVISIAICLWFRAIHVRHLRETARAQRRKRQREIAQRERLMFEAEFGHLFDDGFLDFDQPAYQPKKP